jgi:hypothetical protein
MPWYRTYIIGRADHTMDGRDVEVWERRRFIVRLSSDPDPE